MGERQTETEKDRETKTETGEGRKEKRASERVKEAERCMQGEREGEGGERDRDRKTEKQRQKETETETERHAVRTGTRRTDRQTERVSGETMTVTALVQSTGGVPVGDYLQPIPSLTLKCHRSRETSLPLLLATVLTIIGDRVHDCSK